MPFLRGLLSFFAALMLVDSLRATWSIILVDRRTGEVAIASATCLTGFDLQSNACVVVVGRGAAAAQSFVDLSGMNRMLIFSQLQLGADPQQILAQLAATDTGHQSRQYGIVDTQGRAIGFTGTGAGPWAGHLTGVIGDIVYAVQGNVLTGQAVITAAEQAIRTTPGDLAEKLMAAMEASRVFGGDGRCSCNPNVATQCGAPPPTFTKSAHIGYMLVARPGDTDGVCNGNVGCATGRYHLNINIANQLSSAPDPVYQLRAGFLNWRLRNVLRPDHFLSSCVVEPARLLDDGATTSRLRLVLRDWRGVQLPFGGAQVVVTQLPGGPALPIGAVVDHGDGSYTVPVGPSSQAGTARLKVVVDDGQGPVQISPSPEVTVANDSMWLSKGVVDAAQGGAFDAVLRAGPGFANRPYLLLGSLSGTSPGIALAPGVTLPLVPDGLTYFLLDLAPSTTLLGSLDAQGRRTVPLAVPPGLFASLPVGRLDFAWLALAPLDFASNPAGFDLR